MSAEKKNPKPHQCSTCKPAFFVPILSVFHPTLVPRVGKVDEEDELNDDKDKGSNDPKVKPNYEEQHNYFNFNKHNTADIIKIRGQQNIILKYIQLQFHIYIFFLPV